MCLVFLLSHRQASQRCRYSGVCAAPLAEPQERQFQDLNKVLAVGHSDYEMLVVLPVSDPTSSIRLSEVGADVWTSSSCYALSSAISSEDQVARVTKV